MRPSEVATVFQGCEFSTFLVKEGISDEQLIAACQRMETEFLQHEEGFLHHALLKGDDGYWADAVFTRTRVAAEQICRNFMNNAACLDYLQLIEDGSAKLTFWARAK